MPRMLMLMAALAATTAGVYAQSPAPAGQPAAPAAPAPAMPAPSGDTASQDKPGAGDAANQQSYKMKDGGLYRPPAQRPASPAQDLDVYGRT